MFNNHLLAQMMTTTGDANRKP